ncbi:uncharacterized protein HMPREF1541_04943 [Cyphellophora europaea CBS 101466]|uniref:Uncharacterized protein n=1 Tax=Cyphellophora europaea (strain CBS 101466) TaxID=1220924 RepID=W2RYA7_CYPE1|nr:uncharacterized protein HMPREF1541_04943 [Cyphellophora europaea CBS 101466]ETN40664.1 hypothetical protein HMPREF1541_04943 [Cyphellophora europaea CBS 101466]
MTTTGAASRGAMMNGGDRGHREADETEIVNAAGLVREGRLETATGIETEIDIASGMSMAETEEIETVIEIMVGTGTTNHQGTSGQDHAHQFAMGQAVRVVYRLRGPRGRTRIDRVRVNENAT